MTSKSKIGIGIGVTAGAIVRLHKAFRPLTVGPVVNGVDGDSPDGDEG